MEPAVQEAFLQGRCYGKDTMAAPAQGCSQELSLPWEETQAGLHQLASIFSIKKPATTLECQFIELSSTAS